MIASDLQVSLPTVSRLTPVPLAARLVARSGLPALVLIDDDGAPAALISAADVLRLLLPAGAGERTVGDLLDDDSALVRSPLHVDASIGLDDLAETMAAARAPLAVVDQNPRAPRFVLLSVVMDALLASRPEFDTLG